uniref:Uncharacterized protein n=1 Tax=Peronospora matthiolae TaxID=2874970 RepID=A0AAV1TYI0_9STRA
MDSVGVLSHFAADPCPKHWQALKRVFRYVQGTQTHGIEFQATSNDKLQVYSDPGDVKTQRSTSGDAFLVNNGCISWISKKQRTVALSSTEADYMALTEATQEAVWPKAFLCEIGKIKNDEAVKIYEDDQDSIVLAKNPEFHKRTKHIDIRYHYLREKVADGQVLLQCCATNNMNADLMTKPIPAAQFEYLRGMLGIKTPRSADSSGSVVKDTPRHDVSEKCSVAQPVWYVSTILKVTGSVPVGRANKKVKPSGSGVWGSPALSCQTVTSPDFGTFGCLETHDQN